MPDMKVEGMDEFVRSLTAIGRHTAGVARKCAYDGASLSLCPAGRANGPHLSSGGVLYLSRKTGHRTPAC